MSEKTTDIERLFAEAIDAVGREIEAVREQPSSDVLLAGRRLSPEGGSGTDYRFESHQPSIRFAEKVKGIDGTREWELVPVSFEKNELVLRFPEDAGEEIAELQVEWENDFVLQRTLRELERLSEADDEVIERIRALFEPEGEELPAPETFSDDGERNPAQREAIARALRRPTLFIWGPPGTGKTATLGYVIANYLRQRKRVLFASNTNRAVDVGLLSVLDAADRIGLTAGREQWCRFGEPALEDERVRELQFDRQIEKRLEKRRADASEWAGLLSRREELLAAAEKRLRDGKQPTAAQRTEMELVEAKIAAEGGREALENRVETLLQINERMELAGKRLVATTLAKVCTSELFYQLEFDAVVIDEGSMAGLPWLMVLAARAHGHRVIVGDPMQLPPIALTDQREASRFLEKDIFTTVSGAGSPAELFRWHDENPAFTCFFDTQYRMRPELAELISSVFYEGRLRSVSSSGEAGAGNLLEAGDRSRSWHLIDTSRYRPQLSRAPGERGFRPVNEVHLEVAGRLIGNMIRKGIAPEEIGVMVPFRSSVHALRNRLWQESIRDVEVGTIHTFQGREKPYIIFDMVMSGERQGGVVRHYSVRPLDEEKNGLSVPRLLNVAFSRSKRELMILADMVHVRKVYGEKFLGRLLERMAEENGDRQGGV